MDLPVDPPVSSMLATAAKELPTGGEGAGSSSRSGTGSAASAVRVELALRDVELALRDSEEPAASPSIPARKKRRGAAPGGPPAAVDEATAANEASDAGEAIADPPAASAGPSPPAIGIDLGTTNCVVAVLQDGRPVTVPNGDGRYLTPSVVAFRDGEVLVGEAARRQAVTNPHGTAWSSKRLLGTNRTFAVGGTERSPQEICGRLLLQLRSDTETFLGQPVEDVVVTAPAAFADRARTAIVEAGRIAGLNVMRVVSESTAASLAYRAEDECLERVLVFDLGGGTLDVTILEVEYGVFEVKATAGDASLGGDDWDQRLADWAVAEFREQAGVDLSADKIAMQRLREAVERAKIELSSVSSTQISLPFIAESSGVAKHLELAVTRAAFEDLTSDLLARCRLPTERAIADAVDDGQIDKVILAGGSTRMPAVRDLVRSVTGIEPDASVNPEEVVAAGAAIQAGVLVGQVKDSLLLDATAHSLGIETRGGVMTRIINRNTTIPCRRTELFTTAEDMQRSVEIHVLQGEATSAADATTLAKFQFIDLSPAPRGVPHIEVSFDIDPSGLVHVSAKDRVSGREISMETTADVIPRSELLRLALQAEADRRLSEGRQIGSRLLASKRGCRIRFAPQVAEMLDRLQADLALVLQGDQSDAIEAASHALADAWRKATAMTSSTAESTVVLSYVVEDRGIVDRLVADLTAVGIDVWIDHRRLFPGDSWKEVIRAAIRTGSYFVACFSQNSLSKTRSYMNEELNEAIEESRLRDPGRRWLIPVVLDDSTPPDRPLGAGRFLTDLHWVRLNEDWSTGMRSLIAALTAQE